MSIDRREIARDMMGLGSVPFLLLVLVRVGMVGNFLEFFHILVAVTLFALVGAKWRGLHYHTGRIVILAIFTSIFYDDVYYAVFAVLVGAASIGAFVAYLKIDNVFKSVGVGLVCSLVSYLISLPLGIRNV